MNPLVSVIIPSWNQGRFLTETLESVFAQDYAPLEVFVFDGASKDETVAVLKRYDGRPGFWWKSERDRGVVDAVNQGLARATGEYCVILSSDDCFLPGAVSAAVAALRADPALGLVYADAEYIDAASRVTGRTHVADYSLEGLLSRRTFIMQPSAFFRTRLARDIGGWRPEVSYVADNDLWLRMALAAPFARVPGVWSRYRLHEAQRDTQAERIAREWRAAVEPLLPRLPGKLRRAARLGCLLTEHRYGLHRPWPERTRLLYRAAALDPRCVLWDDFPRVELLMPLRVALSKCKRALLRLLGRPLPATAR
jgi:glycosyltransferase involved in cell wall biosynthesis